MFPYANAHVVNTPITRYKGATSPTNIEIAASAIMPAFQVPAAVDVSGMELALAVLSDAHTGTGQTIATGTTTVVMKPYDGNTNAGAASGNNNLFADEDFSNSATGTSSWTVAHGAMKAVGTSTTDLDADDWVNIEMAANLTTTAGIGVAVLNAYFIYGIPAAIN